MIWRLSGLGIVLGGAMFFWLAPPPAVVTLEERHYQLQEDACRFTPPEDLSVECATLHAPAQKGYFRLPVMILRYTGEDKREAPLVYLQGGPGLAAGIHREGVEQWRHWRDYAGLRRDLIVLDRRGSGGSQPSLACHAYEQASLRWLQQNLSVEEELTEAATVLQHCRQNALWHFQPEDYGTRTSARDLLALMRLLHSEGDWHLLGVSYGSRLAIEAAPEAEGLQSLLLDSVYPPGFGTLDTWPQVLGEALEGFSAACLADAACEALWQQETHSLADPLEALWRALGLLRTTPLRLNVRVGDWPQDVVINDYRFLAAVFSASYERHRWPQALAAILAVNRGEARAAEPLIAAWLRQIFTDDLTSLAFTAVDCRDGALGSDEIFWQSLARYPQLEPYVRAVREVSICRQWGSDEPLQVAPLSIPVALLSGEYDPITPLAWAEWLANQWPHAQTATFSQTGHSVLGSTPCALGRLEAWLEDPAIGWADCGKPQ